MGDQVIVSPLALAVEGMQLRSEDANGRWRRSRSLDHEPVAIPQRNATKDVTAEVAR